MNRLIKLDKKALIKRLDKEFSLYMRTKDCFQGGYAKCVTCGKIAHYKEMDFGHFVQREYFGVRWDEDNGGVQCTYCNRYKEGEKAEMAMYLQNKGVDIQRLINVKRATGKTMPDKMTMIDMIIKYRDLNKSNIFIGVKDGRL